MKKAIALLLVLGYLLFNLGISYNIQYCQNGKVEFSLLSFLFDNQQNECSSFCCHSDEKQQPDCECEDSIYVLDLTDDQIGCFIAKKFSAIFSTNLFNTHISSYAINDASSIWSRINPPPNKTSVQRIISNHQLLFYA
ncbi:MAG: hypothetical protein VX756_01810 [Bacteroidota bacterium]|nr:hypothetical protein [Bacteroidota bacterium]